MATRIVSLCREAEENARETQLFRRPTQHGSKGETMRILYERCCGLDIHKVSMAACAVTTGDGKTKEETRRFGTMTADLLELAAWLKARGIQQVAIAYASHCTSAGR